MKILQVCHKPPYPNVDGGTFAEQSLTSLLVQANYQVDVLTLSTEKHPFKFEQFPDWLIKQGEVFNVNLNTFPSSKGALKNLFTQSSYVTSRFKQPEFKKVLVEKLENNYDLIIFDGLVAAVFLPEIKPTITSKIVLRSHNLEFLVWKNLSEKVANKVKKNYFQLQSNRLKKEEETIFENVDAIWHLNPQELKLFPPTLKSKVWYLPVCINIFNIPIEKKANGFAVGFIGAMNWQPNFEAALYIKEQLSKIFSESEVEVVLAGRFQNEELKANTFFKNLGEVEKPSDFFEKIDVFVNPVFSGSGIRIKILDAIRYQKPIISTSKGIEGWGLIPNLHYLEANTPEEFLTQSMKLKNNKDLRISLAQNSLHHFQTNFGFETTIAMLQANLSKL